MSTTLSGGCLCGAIRYTISAPVNGLRACHCRNCQKASGGGGTVNAVVPDDSLKITKGTPKAYQDAATQSGRTLSRYFCADCGSPLFSHRNPKPGFVTVRAGSIDDTGGLKVTGNIWTASARSWSHIDPSTDCHPEGMPNPAPK